MLSWADVSSADPDASLHFYAGLLGWTRLAQANGGLDEAEAGGYTVLGLDGRPVAGLGPVAEPDRPGTWTTYVGAIDLAAVSAAAARAGGHVVAGPLDAFGGSRLAVLADPSGAVIGAWRPGAIRGAELLGRPGAYCWSELVTRDTAAAERFYGAVFGWVPARDTATGYTEWKLVDRTVAGMLAMGPEWPAGAAAHWMVHLAVADCDRAAATAADLGGAVLVPPADGPPGRLAVVEDPGGAVLSLVELRPPA
jgi:predicted enzyme related to lactoylglutathione lyase